MCYARHRWEALSVEAQELVMGLLDYDTNKRLTAQEVHTPPSFGLHFAAAQH